ncbi:zinc-binding dehydrogenase [Streptomyces noursei]|uniref:zinc-binding dehydrogenase n=1 Tax=Streptomyces noursei TaxID=1971 RepID=UPI0015E13D37|nr:zinc-binding dehydrogenase [Streptomyces noursei]
MAWQSAASRPLLRSGRSSGSPCWPGARRPRNGPARKMAELAGHAAPGRLRAAVHARLPLADAPAVHRLIEERSHVGRILVLP